MNKYLLSTTVAVLLVLAAVMFLKFPASDIPLTSENTAKAIAYTLAYTNTITLCTSYIDAQQKYRQIKGGYTDDLKVLIEFADANALDLPTRLKEVLQNSLVHYSVRIIHIGDDPSPCLLAIADNAMPTMITWQDKIYSARQVDGSVRIPPSDDPRWEKLEPMRRLQAADLVEFSE